ncbi:MAG: hypothetical protein N838_31490 [Thiohalocapsa sp. PB-PSB1]|jgi:hypothetical protein|nr:MAG: hypothetical protein N838_31490 [Thiohalocapsa sp. PB-PSB1]
MKTLIFVLAVFLLVGCTTQNPQKEWSKPTARYSKTQYTQEQTVRLQRFLKEEGYYDGRITGVYDSETHSAKMRHKAQLHDKLMKRAAPSRTTTSTTISRQPRPLSPEGAKAIQRMCQETIKGLSAMQAVDGVYYDLDNEYRKCMRQYTR